MIIVRKSLLVIGAALVTTGCADQITGPVATAGGSLLDQSPSGCVSDGVCILEPVVVIGQPGNGGGWGGGGGGGGGGSSEPERGACPTSLQGYDVIQGCTAEGYVPIDEGPGTFAACVGTLLVLMGTTSALEPLAHDLYDARSSYDSAKRMYDAVMANNPSLEMELLYAHAVEVAKNGYQGAVRAYALAAGSTVLAVGGAVLVCSPGMILPTP